MSLQAPTIIDVKLKQNKTVIVNLQQPSYTSNILYEVQLSSTALTHDWSGSRVNAFSIFPTTESRFQINANFYWALYNTSYFIRIRAIKSDTQMSAWVPYITNGQYNAIQFKRYPIAPTNLQANLQRDGSIRLLWSPIQESLENTGGYSIEKYKVYSYLTPTFITSISGVPIDSTTTEAVIPASLLSFGKLHYIKVAAFDELGQEGNKTEDIQVIPITYPAAPSRINANAGDSSITVSWIDGADNGSPITGYKFYVTISGQSNATYVPSVTILQNKSAILNGLINGIRYCVQVAALNNIGEGTLSVYSSYVKPVSAPRIYNISGEASTSQILLEWTEDWAGGNFLVANIQKSTDGPTNGFIDISPSDIIRDGTKASIRNIINGIPYWFAIRGRNENGFGEYSIIGPITPIDIPSNVKLVSNSGNRQLEIIWSATTFTPITSAEVAILDASNTFILSAQPQQGTTAVVQSIINNKKIIVNNLVNGQKYTFRVRLLNRIGYSDFTYITDDPRTVPSPPILSIKPTNTTLYIDISLGGESGSGGRPITDYVINISSTGPNGTYENPSSYSWIDGFKGISIYQLINGNRYDVRIAAVNEKGQGAWGYIQGKPQTIPSQPTVTYIPYHKQLEVRWILTDFGGADFASYDLFVDNVKQQRTYVYEDGLFKQTISGLDNEKVYTIGVCAVNDSGNSEITTITATPTGYPGLPIVTVTPISYSEIQVDIKEPTNRGNLQIDGYKIYIGGNENNISIGEGEITTYIISILERGTTYTIGVAAVNTYGTGEILQIQCATLIDKVVRFKQIPYSSSIIGGYYVYYRDITTSHDICGGVYYSNPSSLTDVDVVIYRLNPLKTYEYSIRAFNKSSIGPPSNIPAVIPTNFSGIIDNDGMLKLSWSSIDDNCIYELSGTPSLIDNNIQYGQAFSSLNFITGQSITLNGLLYNQQYTFRIRSKKQTLDGRYNYSDYTSYNTTLYPKYEPIDISYTYPLPNIVRLNYSLINNDVKFRGLCVSGYSAWTHISNGQSGYVDLSGAAGQPITFRLQQKYLYENTEILSLPSSILTVTPINVPYNLLLSDISWSTIITVSGVIIGKGDIKVNWAKQPAVAVEKPFDLTAACGFLLSLRETAALPTAPPLQQKRLSAVVRDFTFTGLQIGAEYIISIAAFNECGMSSGILFDENGILLEVGESHIIEKDMYAVENETITISGNKDIIISWESADSVLDSSLFKYEIRGYKYGIPKVLNKVLETRDPIEEFYVGSITVSKGEKVKKVSIRPAILYGFYYKFFIDFVYLQTNEEGIIELDELSTN